MSKCKIDLILNNSHRRLEKLSDNELSHIPEMSGYSLRELYQNAIRAISLGLDYMGWQFYDEAEKALLVFSFGDGNEV